MHDQKIFALDIGTRSVVGIILEEKEDTYHVVDILVKEHKERAMLDGQIHDIAAVANVIIDMKSELETIHGPLKKVCVAAAGRALKTERARATVPIGGKPMLEKEDILYLELTAVQHAQATAAEKQEIGKIDSYYCVGYSVLHYFLDGEIIGNLIDQQGDEATVEIIATFLPKVVVDSLIKALNRAGLELDALTLEPIAAINVLVPASMRRLNVALVDIGAGTSDIAITDAGTVIAYGMVPIAGDEVTEAFSDQLLLDFPVAEQSKRKLWIDNSIVVTDILGFETEISKEEIVEKISPAIDKLAKAIANEIKSLNNDKSPKAVMLVGGGSMTPELPKRLAAELGLPDNRVAIRGADAIQGLTFAEAVPGGPENITPIGIAISARRSPIHYVTVTVNESTVRMFEAKKLTVADCILASGISVSKLYGKPGLAIFVTMNGQQLTIPGSYGEPPLILKNGQPSSLEEIISDGDKVIAQKGDDGQPSQVKIGEFLDDIPDKEVIINGQTYVISALVTRNGKKADLTEVIKDRDIIQIHYPETVEDALHILGLNDMLRPFHLQINGVDTFIPAFSADLLLNERKAKYSDKLPVKAELKINRKNIPTAGNLAAFQQYTLKRSITVTFNGKPIHMEKNIAKFERDGRILEADDLLHNGDQLEIESMNAEAFIFQDIFKYVEIEKPAHSAGNFHLLKNGGDAAFYTPINSGDELEIIWPSVRGSRIHN